MRTTLLLVLALPCSTLGACDCGGAAPFELAGTWDFTWTVEAAEGPCSSEVGQVSSGAIEIQEGATAAEYDLTGFGDDPNATLSGTFENNTLQFEGSYADDSGTTVSSTTLDLSSDNTTLTGTEDWSWGTDAQPDTCPSATSSVTATKQ